MSETPTKNIGRSIWSIVAGFLVVVALSIGTDVVLHATGVFPALGKRMSEGLFILATVYRTAFGVLGSYVTARLAPEKPMKHALIGAAIGFVLATIGAVATWNSWGETPLGTDAMSGFSLRVALTKSGGGAIPQSCRLA
jgi:hypothetical protein